MSTTPPRHRAAADHPAESGTEDVDQVSYDIDRDLGTHLDGPAHHRDRVAPFAGSVDQPTDEPNYDIERDVGI